MKGEIIMIYTIEYKHGGRPQKIEGKNHYDAFKKAAIASLGVKSVAKMHIFVNHNLNDAMFVVTDNNKQSYGFDFQ